jgi:transposase
MFFPGKSVQVYLATGSTDMRKSIDSLSILVADRLDLDPFSGYLFCFCNRKKDMVKILYWDRNGFCLWHNHPSSHYTSFSSSAGFCGCIYF